MTQLTHLRYVGGGMARPGLPQRDLDHAEVRLLPLELRDAAISSGLYLPTFVEDEEADGSAPAPDGFAQASGPSGPFLWTGPNPVTEAQLAAADDAGVDPAEILGRASYNDLRSLAKARGLDTKGTRLVLIERLVASEPAADDAGESD